MVTMNDMPLKCEEGGGNGGIDSSLVHEDELSNSNDPHVLGSVSGDVVSKDIENSSFEVSETNLVKIVTLDSKPVEVKREFIDTDPEIPEECDESNHPIQKSCESGMGDQDDMKGKGADEGAMISSIKKDFFEGESEGDENERQSSGVGEEEYEDHEQSEEEIMDPVSEMDEDIQGSSDETRTESDEDESFTLTRKRSSKGGVNKGKKSDKSKMAKQSKLPVKSERKRSDVSKKKKEHPKYRVKVDPKDGSNLYQCRECNYSTTYKCHVNQHAKRIHDKIKDFVCPTCGRKFASKTELNRHNAHVHERVRKFACIYCNYMAGTKADLCKHVTRIHDKSKDYACDQCEWAFSTKQELDSHLQRIHSNVRPWSCSQCTFATMTKNRLMKHIDKAHSTTSSSPSEDVHSNFSMVFKRCRKCDEVFDSVATFRAHMRDVHNKGGKGSFKAEKMIPKCRLCDFTCSFRKSLYMHVENEHGSDAFFRCEECPRMFIDSKGLSNHFKKKHDRKNDFKCERCDAVFAFKSRLTIHEKRVHDNIRDYVCETCGDAFVTNCELSTHKRVTHDAPPGSSVVKCDQCDFATTFKTSLYAHLKRVHQHGAKPRKIKSNSAAAIALTKGYHRDHLIADSSQRMTNTAAVESADDEQEHGEEEEEEKHIPIGDMSPSMPMSNSMLKCTICCRSGVWNTRRELENHMGYCFSRANAALHNNSGNNHNHSLSNSHSSSGLAHHSSGGGASSSSVFPPHMMADLMSFRFDHNTTEQHNNLHF